MLAMPQRLRNEGQRNTRANRRALLARVHRDLQGDALPSVLRSRDSEWLRLLASSFRRLAEFRGGGESMTQEFDQSIRDARLVARYLGRRIGDYHYRYRNEKLLIAVDSSNVSVKLMTSTRTLVLEWTGDVVIAIPAPMGDVILATLMFARATETPTTRFTHSSRPSSRPASKAGGTTYERC